MNDKSLIDTDVLIDYLRGIAKAVQFLEKIIENSICYISVITVAELYAGVKEGSERKNLEKFLRAFEIVDIDNSIAQQGGLYRRDYGKSHGVGLADALIASTNDFYDSELVTLNKKHFPMVKKIFVPYKK